MEEGSAPLVGTDLGAGLEGGTRCRTVNTPRKGGTGCAGGILGRPGPLAEPTPTLLREFRSAQRRGRGWRRGHGRGPGRVGAFYVAATNCSNSPASAAVGSSRVGKELQEGSRFPAAPAISLFSFPSGRSLGSSVWWWGRGRGCGVGSGSGSSPGPPSDRL